MRSDVIDALSGRMPARIPSKETLEHPGIIRHVAGFSVHDDTPTAFDLAWRKLGIDIHGALPPGNTPRPRVPGGTWEEGGRRYSDYGVHPTSMPVEHAVGSRKEADDWVFGYDTSRDDFDLPSTAASLKEACSAFRRHFGETAVMYRLYSCLIRRFDEERAVLGCPPWVGFRGKR